MFLKNFVIKQYKHLGLNKHLIDLTKYKQLSYKPIYSFELMQFKTLKTCSKKMEQSD